MNKVDNGSMLTLRTLGIGEEEPYRYEVIGLPTGRGAMLARLSGVWKILKIERGKSYAWTGSFVSADDALTSLAGDALALQLESVPIAGLSLRGGQRDEPVLTRLAGVSHEPL